MAKTLTIAGSNFLPQYMRNSAQINERIQNKSNTLRMSIIVIPSKGHTAPSEGSEVIFKDGSRFLFSGFITKTEATETGKGGKFRYDIEVTDYTYIFSNKIASIAYQNRTLKYIVEDLVARYVDSGYSIDTTNVDTGPTITSVTFDHISLRAAFEKLNKLTGYVWRIDYERKLFFKATDSTAAPEDLRDSGTINHEWVAIDYDTTQVRNSVVVIGSGDGEGSAATSVETFTGDGESRVWEIDDRPDSVVSIKLNGEAKQFSLDLNERESDYFTYNFESKSFEITTGNPTPTGSDTIEIEYYPRIPIIVEQSDQTSIDFFAALENGGDGIYQETIKDTSITSKDEARSRAQQELDEFADPLVDGRFKTRTGLLQAASIFTAGQFLTVNLPTWGIASDNAFLIQEVRITMDEDDDAATTEYHYEVRFGGRMVGVQTFLEALASDGTDQISESDEIFTIFRNRDSFTHVDTVTRENFTPPFKYADPIEQDSESFETDFGAWVNVAGDNYDWTRNSGATGSVDTGPSAAYDGSFYIYTESSSPNYPAQTAIIEYTNTGNKKGLIEFAYHMYQVSGTAGTLYLEAFDGVSWSELWSITGNQGTDWLLASIQFPLGTQKLRFRAVTEYWQNDFALDAITVSNYESPQGKWNLSEWS